MALNLVETKKVQRPLYTSCLDLASAKLSVELTECDRGLGVSGGTTLRLAVDTGCVVAADFDRS